MPDTPLSPDVSLAILGAHGFLGVKALAEFVTNYKAPQKDHPRIVIYGVDAENRIGGAAYASPRTEWKLNVPHQKMSFDEKKGNDFTSFLEKEGEVPPKDDPYATRSVYGKYLTQKYSEAVALAKEKGIDYREIKGEVFNLLRQDDGSALIKYKENGVEADVRADVTLIALGNQNPPPLVPTSSDIYHPLISQTPLKELGVTEEQLQDAKQQGVTPTFILRGFGNTGVDVAFSLFELAERAQTRVKVIGVQRHNAGIVKHPEHSVPYDASKFDGHTTAAGLYKAFKTALEGARLERGAIIGGDPALQQGRNVEKIDSPSMQDVGDGLRSRINKYSNTFSPEELSEWKLKYNHEYRHLRNRVIPSVGAVLDQKIKSGELELITGDLKVIDTAGRLRAEIVRKTPDGAPDTITIKQPLRIFNTVSPAAGLDASEFFKNLRQNGIVDDSYRDGFRLKPGSHRVDSKQDLKLFSVSQLNVIDPGGVRELREVGAAAGREILQETKEILQETGKLPASKATSTKIMELIAELQEPPFSKHAEHTHSAESSAANDVTAPARTPSWRNLTRRNRPAADRSETFVRTSYVERAKDKSASPQTGRNP